MLSALPILMIVMFPAQLNRVMDSASYVVFHNISEFFSIMVSFSIFGVGWYTYDQSKNRHALFLSVVFLAIGLLDFLHTFGNVAMPAFITPNSSNKSTQFWIAARLFQAFGILVSAYIYPETQSRLLSKTTLLTTALSVPALVFTGITFFPAYMPDTFVPGVGLTLFKKFSEYMIVVLLCTAALAYWQRMGITGSRVITYYMAAFIVGIFSEITFAVYTSVFDTYNVLGHIYKIAAFFLIYKGIFIASVKEPYVKLTDMTVSRDELSREIEVRNQAEDALRTSEQRYHSLFENMVEGLAYCKMLFDERGRAADFVYLDVNSAFGRLTGLENVIGKKVTEAIPGIKESHPELFEIYGRVALTGSPARLDIEFAPLNIWLSLSVYSTEKGYFVAVFDNITERKRLDEDLQRQTNELAAVNKDLEAFSYGISHELKAPLRSIEGFTKAIIEDCADKLDETGKDYFNRIVVASRRMSQQIEALLSMSRLTRSELREKTVNLSDIAQLITYELKKSQPMREVKFSIADEIIVHGDFEMLRIVMENLLANAWKFTGKLQKAVIEFGALNRGLRNADCGIKTEIENPKFEIVYFVRDNGVGFDVTYADRLFQPFKRLHKEEEFPGLGIGLAAVHKIINKHGGKIWAESEVGKGATVYFTL